MDKGTQKQISHWLKGISIHSGHWLKLAMVAGFVGGLAVIGQAWLIAETLYGLIILEHPIVQFHYHLAGLAALFVVKAVALYVKEIAGFEAGARVRQYMREQILSKLHRLGPAHIQQQASGAWSSAALEQVENLQEFYAKYLPQMSLVVMIPIAILVVVFPINWAAGLIFVVTAPLTLLFMAVVGMGASDANKRNFLALARLSGHFLDRVKGLQTVRLFNRLDAELARMELATDTFRKRTMEVLRMAFLSSAVLEFFASISIALVAVYFGFSYLGELNFGHYGAGVSLFTGLLVLILAPEFFQPFRDLGTYYHAKAQAVGAAESLMKLLEQSETEYGESQPQETEALNIKAIDLEVLSSNGTPLNQPVSFDIPAGTTLTIGGLSGCGKTSVIQAVMGFMPYRGSLTVNGIEVASLDRDKWLKQISWLGQNPKLFHGSIRDNLKIAKPDASDDKLWQALALAQATEFITPLPDQLDHQVGERAGSLSVGQAQRIALARALLKNAKLLVLDEPSASLDAHNEKLVQNALNEARKNQTTIWVSHNPLQLSLGDNTLLMTTKGGSNE